MRSFTYRDSQSHKFWNIVREGTRLTVTSGRVNTKGRTVTRKFPSPKQAQAEHDRLIQKKLAEGYVESTSAAPAAEPSLRAALEAAITENPDDLAAHMAYADHLMEQGDPLGELVQVQLALEDPTRPAQERKQLKKRETALLREHHRTWLGALGPVLRDTPPYMDDAVGIARGWLEYIRFGSLDAETARAMVQEPRTRLLRELTIEEVLTADMYDNDLDEDEAPAEDPIALLAGSPYLGNVRVFSLGTRGDEVSAGGAEAYYYNAWWQLYTAGQDALKLIGNLERLEELYLFVDTSALFFFHLFGSRKLTNLRTLVAYLADNYPLDVLANNPALRKLEHLAIYPRATDRDNPHPFVDLQQAAALLGSKHLPALRHLSLRQTALGDAICQELVDSGIMQRLKVLDLSRGCITDEGARILAGCPEELANLERLDLSCNALTRQGVRLLRPKVKELRADEQHDADDNEYLFEGQME
jgi:uncharacterized protein (TIGR02996 family)